MNYPDLKVKVLKDADGKISITFDKKALMSMSLKDLLKAIFK